MADALKLKREYMSKIESGFFVGLVLLAPAANAQFARQEVIAFESAMMSPEDFLASKDGTPVRQKAGRGSLSRRGRPWRSGFART
jgi:hypothetical protein